MVLGMPFLFRKITIIGVGLIGGSLGLAIKKHRLAKEVYGFSRSKETLAQAMQLKAVDQVSHDVKTAVSNADLVILATPVNVVPAMMAMIAPHIRRNCIVTDVGSTKVSIVAAAKESLPNPSMFVGSHPLAGSEKKGVEFASVDLFADSTCLMTPVDDTHRVAAAKIKKFWTLLGLQVRILTPAEHDAVLAQVSHLPHIVAFALMNTISHEALTFGAQGLKDTTRIAGSTPQIWADICLANSGNIIKVLDEMAGNLAVVRKAIIEGDEKTLLNEFKQAKAKRDRIK